MKTRFLCPVVFLLSTIGLTQSTGPSSSQAGNTALGPQQLSSGLAEPYHRADFTPVIANGSHGVAWGKGHLVSFSLGEVKEPIVFYNRDGGWTFQAPFTFQKAARTFIQDAVATPSGMVVVAASVVNSDGGSADLIAEVGQNGIRRVIRTSPFYPFRVCAADDGTVWAYGHELTAERNHEPRVHYSVLREYSFEKGELRSALDRATVLLPQGVPMVGKRDELQMRCNSSKVVVINGPTNELMEYDLSASQLRRWPMAPLPNGADITSITGAALTDSGRVYVSAYDAPHVKALTRILRIDVTPRGTAEWTSVAAIPSEGKVFVLLGSDGEDFVYSRGRHAPTVFWSQGEKEVTK